MSAHQVGWVTFSEVITYKNAEQFEADCLRHGVQHDTAYSWIPGKTHHLLQKIAQRGSFHTHLSCQAEAAFTQAFKLLHTV